MEHVLKKLDEQAKQLGNIEKALVQLAVQDSEIKGIQTQLLHLWEKMENMYKTDGPVNSILISQSKLIERQKSCKVNSLATQVKILWVTIVGGSLTIIFKFMGEIK